MEINETKKPRKKRVVSKNKAAVEKRRLAKIARDKLKAKAPKKKKTPYVYNGKFLPYDRAKKVVKVLSLKSRAEYVSWHEQYHPDYLPKRPDNAYKKEFEGWDIFLSKPPKGVLSDRAILEKKIKEDRIKKQKETIKETKKLKTHLTAIVKHEVKLAQNKANRLKRRELIALSNYKKEKKKIVKRQETPLPAIEYKPKKKKIPSKYISYEEASRSIQGEGFSNIKEYLSWWDINQPAGIPKRPDRIYENFKWSSYLGKEEDDRFKKKNYRKIYRTYEESVRYVRTLGIKNAKGWDDYYKTGKCPKDIPRYPHLVYQYRTDDPEWGKWFSWEEWLGTNANFMVEAFKEQTRVVIVTVPKGAPKGIYSFVYYKGSDKDIDNFIDDNELYVIRVYKIDKYDWSGYLSRRYDPYQGNANVFVIPNINEVLFDLDEYMERIL